VRTSTVVTALFVVVGAALLDAPTPVAAQAAVESPLTEQGGGGGFTPCGEQTCVRSESHLSAQYPVRGARAGRAPFRIAAHFEDCGPDFEYALVLTLVDAATNQGILEMARLCPPPPPEDPNRWAGLVPTAQAVWDEVPLPAPALEIVPACRGVVGLPARVWSTPSAPVTAAVELGGQTYAVEAEPVGWRAEVVAEAVPEQVAEGGGVEPTLVAGAEPGSSEAPLGELVLERRGRYAVRVTETWTGRYVGPAGDAYTLDHVDVTTTAAPYDVVEVQAVIVGAGTPAAPDPSATLACRT
jgi:hypothetical protein